jgi:sensor histidine kinase YesM
MKSTFAKRIQIAFWIMLFSFNLYLSFVVLGWTDGFLRSIINVTCHLINFYGFYQFIVPRFYQKKKYFHTVISSLVILAFLAPFRLIIETDFALTDNFALRFGFAGSYGFVLFTEISVAAFASLLRLAEYNEINKQRLDMLSRMQVESELRFLKSQMNPHFLFNTINNIYSLILVKSDKAPKAVLKLSGLLRYLLYESNEKVSLQKEVQALYNYSELFQLRYENVLKIEIENTVNKEIFIEPHVLIPILENALKHSGLGVVPVSYANMKIAEDNDCLLITSTNSKNSSNRNEEAGGIGLINITKRLQLAYENKHDIKVSETTHEYNVTLKLHLS